MTLYGPEAPPVAILTNRVSSLLALVVALLPSWLAFLLPVLSEQADKPVIAKPSKMSWGHFFHYYLLFICIP